MASEQNPWPGGGAGAPFGGDLRTSNLDLGLAAAIALGLPFLAAWLLRVTGGALAGLLMYYGVACTLVVFWRKRTLDYRRPARWPWRLFAAGLLLVGLITATNIGAYQGAGAAPLGVALTALIWAPLNGAMEQLSWQYVLDAWRGRWASGRSRWLAIAVGVVLLLTLVTLIHLLFWTEFLPQKRVGAPLWLTPALNTALTAVYVLLYYRSRSMWPTFVIHTLVDLQLVLLARYSIGPDL